MIQKTKAPQPKQQHAFNTLLEIDLWEHEECWIPARKTRTRECVTTASEHLTHGVGISGAALGRITGTHGTAERARKHTFTHSLRI